MAINARVYGWKLARFENSLQVVDSVVNKVAEIALQAFRIAVSSYFGAVRKYKSLTAANFENREASGGTGTQPE